MDKERMFFTAIIVAFIGLILLSIVSLNLKSEKLRVCGVNEGKEGEKVSVRGYVSSLRELSTGGKSFYLYENECGVKVVFFDEGLTIKKGDEVRVEGVVNIYNGGVEIVLDRIYHNI